MEIITKQDYFDFIDLLRQSASDEKFRKMNENTTKTKQQVLGIRTPVMREIATQISYKKHDGLWAYGADYYYEETLVRGFVIGTIKNYDEMIKRLNDFIPHIDNWATCDMVSNSLKIFKVDVANKYYSYFKKLAKSKKEFECRFGFVNIMCHYINEKNINDIIELIKNNTNTAYYVQMAVAWLIAEACLIFEDKVVELLKEKSLDKFVQNKAIQKIRESYRIDNTLKEELLLYKK